MADPIRPGLSGAPPPPRPDTVRTAAQRAFFQTAGGASSTQTQAPTRVQAPPEEPVRVQKLPAQLPAEPPKKILRPGSLLDIRV